MSAILHFDISSMSLHNLINIQNMQRISKMNKVSNGLKMAKISAANNSRNNLLLFVGTIGFLLSGYYLWKKYRNNRGQDLREEDDKSESETSANE